VHLKDIQVKMMMVNAFKPIRVARIPLFIFDKPEEVN
jgi:hypothetical protein